MPTYEYRCPACGTDFEKFQRISDQPAAECPSCGAAAERRISAGAGLVFKGSGFYITDYKRAGNGKPSEGGASGSKGESPASAEKSSGSKGGGTSSGSGE